MAGVALLPRKAAQAQPRRSDAIVSLSRFDTKRETSSPSPSPREACPGRSSARGSPRDDAVLPDRDGPVPCPADPSQAREGGKSVTCRELKQLSALIELRDTKARPTLKHQVLFKLIRVFLVLGLLERRESFVTG
jgi:hypothetical protein